MLQLTDIEMAEAVVDGLANARRCAICLDSRIINYACFERDQTTGDMVGFCSGCVAEFQKRHGLYRRSDAERLVRYAAFRGWTNRADFFRNVDVDVIRQRMAVDKEFRPKWL